MSNIYAIGESILDIIFKDYKPIEAKPGGSSFNAAISMGRLGLPVTFISELGKDIVGDIIVNFLNENYVGSNYIDRFPEGQTAIALAFLNQLNDAEYQFYKDYPYQRFNVEIPEFNKSDYLLFGSFYAINPNIRPRIELMIEKAVGSGTLILYDPNFRESHMKEREQLLDTIRQNMAISSIIRASDEDLKNIFGVTNPEEAWKIIRPLCNVLIYTANSKGIYLRTGNLNTYVEIEPIVPVSTIGAGDTFNAGLLYGLFSNKITADHIEYLEETKWIEIIKTAAEFSKQVCLSYENYLSQEYARRFASKT